MQEPTLLEQLLSTPREPSLSEQLLSRPEAPSSAEQLVAQAKREHLQDEVKKVRQIFSNDVPRRKYMMRKLAYSQSEKTTSPAPNPKSYSKYRKAHSELRNAVKKEVVKREIQQRPQGAE